MKLQDALSHIYAPKGMSSLISGVMSGDFDSIRNQDATGAGLEKARAELERSQDAQRNCKSDAAYWGYMGDISYWRAVVNILQAAEITGADNLPNITPPTVEGRIVMDACSAVEKYGKEILAAAESEA